MNTRLFSFKTALRVYHVFEADDPEPLDPMEQEMGHVGQILCWHNRYKLGDNHGWKTHQDWEHSITGGDET